MFRAAVAEGFAFADAARTSLIESFSLGGRTYKLQRCRGAPHFSRFHAGGPLSRWRLDQHRGIATPAAPPGAERCL